MSAAGAGGDGPAMTTTSTNTSTNTLNLPKPSLPLPHDAQRRQNQSAQSSSTWNMTNLGLRLGADTTAAASAAILVSPLVCIIDRSIVTKVSSNQPLTTCLWQCLRSALQRPHSFLVSKPFLLIFGLYFSTYTAANGTDTLTSTMRNQPAATVTSTPTKFATTSAVNMSLCVYKDSCFARWFGSTSPTGSAGAATAPRVPGASYLLFAIRDSLTIFASFNLPPLIAPQLANLPPAIQQNFSRILATEAGRNNTAQFIAPALMQVFSTPVHLLALDLFNRQGSDVGWKSRVARIGRDWGVSVVARMSRIVPAFGVGGVVNASVRRDLMARLK